MAQEGWEKQSNQVKSTYNNSLIDQLWINHFPPWELPVGGTWARVCTRTCAPTETGQAGISRGTHPGCRLGSQLLPRGEGAGDGRRGALLGFVGQLEANQMGRVLHRTLAFAVVLILDCIVPPNTGQVAREGVSQVSHLELSLAQLLVGLLKISKFKMWFRIINQVSNKFWTWGTWQMFNIFLNLKFQTICL